MTKELETLRQELRGFGAFLEDNCTDTRPGFPIDVEKIISQKKDYVESLRRSRHLLSGDALQSFNRALELAAAMMDEHSILAAENALMAAYDAITGLVAKPDNRQHQAPDDGIVFREGIVYFGKKNIGIPAESDCHDILKKLVDSMPDIVKYSDLSSESTLSASVELRDKISKIRKALKCSKTQFSITSTRSAGYALIRK